MELTDTKKLILDNALDFASLKGLEALTIGELAKAVSMSKSGLFGHFNSKENLQLSVLEYAANHFTANVVVPAIKQKKGVERIHALMRYWHRWSHKTMPGGCPFLSANVEFDCKPGKVRDLVKKYKSQMVEVLDRAARVCVEVGDFQEDTDTSQFAYELYGNIIAFHIYKKLLDDRNAEKRFKASYNKLISSYSL